MLSAMFAGYAGSLVCGEDEELLDLATRDGAFL